MSKRGIRHTNDPLDGGPQCRMLILRNGNFTCLGRLFSGLCEVDYTVNNVSSVGVFFLLLNVTCQVLELTMSHVPTIVTSRGERVPQSMEIQHSEASIIGDMSNFMKYILKI